MRKVNYIFSFLVLVSIFSVISCKKNSGESTSENGGVSQNDEPKRFELIDNKSAGIDFQNNIEEDFANNVNSNQYIYIGGGVAVIDYDKDGLQDLYLVNTQKECKLFKNLGNFKFKDVTKEAGVGASGAYKTGVTIVDINGDGYQDMYVCRTDMNPEKDRTNLFFINNKNGTFTESAKKMGLADNSPSNHANFFDFDLDGDLDVYILNYPTDFKTVNRALGNRPGVEPIKITKPDFPWESDRFYRNNGNGTFSDITAQAGLINRAFGLSVTVSDFNNDLYPDILCANDYIDPDFLYVNNKNGTFSNKIAGYFRHMTHHSMGSDIADLNNDGFMDYMSVDMLAPGQYRQKKLMTIMVLERYQALASLGYGNQVMRNVLQINNGNGSFSDVACLAGVFQTDWSWSPLMADYDNDGWKDIFISNGIPRDMNDQDFIHFSTDSIAEAGGMAMDKMKSIYDFINLMPSKKLKNYLYKNKGDLTFSDVGQSWGLNEEAFSNGAAYADLDNDGDLEIIVNNIGDQPFLYKNISEKDPNKGNWIQIKCEGPSGNTLGIGTVVNAFSKSGIQKWLINPVRGFLSSSEPIAHFGFGKESEIEKLEIIWPNGNLQVIQNPKLNQKLIVKYQDAKQKYIPLKNTQEKYFAQTNTGVNFFAKEDPYEDFNTERLLPRRISAQGPCMIKGDINGDGLVDVFVGGAKGSPAKLFLQNASQKFSPSSPSDFVKDSLYEDTGAVFFDYDKDNDLDLVVVSGGNTDLLTNNMYPVRLYKNDGKGGFTRAREVLDGIQVSSKAIAAIDIDGDKDLDLLIGGRCVPKEFPLTPQSYILKNDNGKFRDATLEISQEWGSQGMVTDIAIGDFIKGGNPEIIVCGDWMPIKMYSLSNSKLKDISSSMGLSKTGGWWNSLSVVDMDQDGDLDVLAGNLGLNTRFSASTNSPLKLYANDFDGNSFIDPVMAWKQGKDYYPVATRDLLIKQIPSLRKDYLKYRAYATATMDDVFAKKGLSEAKVFESHILASGWFENKGDLMAFHPFEIVVQSSPVMKWELLDINNDGLEDILAVGNDNGMEVESGLCDAGNGVVLLNQGKGKYQFVPGHISGFWATDDARSIISVPLGKQNPSAPSSKRKNLVIVGNNRSNSVSYYQK
jgi:enediyne biosynthesis protein E4